MPLRVITRPDTGTLWIVGTVRPAGAQQGWRVRQRAGSDSEALASEEATALETSILRNYHLGERPRDFGFSHAVENYLKAKPRSAGTLALIDRLHRHFGNVPLRTIGQEAVDEARDVVLRAGASPATVKRNLIVPLRAILWHAHRRGWCDAPRFEIPREPRGRTRFMVPEQAETLIGAASGRDRHLAPLLRFLVCTGCRLGETLALEWSQVDIQGGRVRLWADQTKARTERVITLPPAAVAALADLPRRQGRVFLTYRGTDYRDSEVYGGQIKHAWASACARAELPGFSPHDLRHTWASWHYAIHRDLLQLKAAGGWSSVGLVERYAHLMPVGHEAGIKRVWGII